MKKAARIMLIIQIIIFAIQSIIDVHSVPNVGQVAVSFLCLWAIIEG